MIAIHVRNEQEAGRVLIAIEGLVHNPTGLMNHLGRVGANLLKKHFRQLDDTHPNKQGGRRQHFWRDVADSVQNPVIAGQRATISITHPVFAHKAGLGPAGGNIVPKETQWLAIPATAEAYGLSPRSFEQGGGTTHKLTFIKISNSLALLVEVIKGQKKFVVEYVLKKHVYQPRFPEALPDPDLFGEQLVRAATVYLTAEIQGIVGSGGTVSS